MLLIDAANVVGSRPNGWWRDRPAAAREFVDQVRAAAARRRLPEPITVVLEGAARAGVAEGTVDGVAVVHAPGSGDDTVVALIAPGMQPVVVVSSDRALRHRAARAGAEVRSPRWLLRQLDG